MLKRVRSRNFPAGGLLLQVFCAGPKTSPKCLLRAKWFIRALLRLCATCRVVGADVWAREAMCSKLLLFF